MLPRKRYIAEAKLGEKGEQLLIAEAAIGKDGDAAAGRHELGQPPQARILEIIAPILQFVLPDAQPQERSRSAMAGDLRWTRLMGQFGGFAKLGSGSCQAASFAVSFPPAPIAA